MKQQIRRLLAFAMAIMIIITFVQLPVEAASTEPVIGDQPNAAAEIAISNPDGTNFIPYNANTPIAVGPNNRGVFNLLTFGPTNTFYMSATVTFEEMVAGYGSIRLVLGKGTKAGSQEKYIEVCNRPGLNQQILFLNGGGEDAPIVEYKGFTEVKAYRYTIKYENGKVSFWIASADDTGEGTQICNNYDVRSILSNIELQPGFYAQECKGKISDLKIWGDVTAVRRPVFASNDTNVMTDVIVENPLTGTTAKLPDCTVSTENTDGTEMKFYGIEYGKTFHFSTNATFYDNTNGSPWDPGTEVTWEGLRFRMATAKKNDTTCNIELAVRSNMVVLFAGNEALEIKYINTRFGASHLYTLDYQESGKFSFFKDDMSVFANYQLPDTYTNIEPCLGLGSELSAFTFADIKLWGDITVDAAPEFNKTTDTNLMEKVVVTNPLTGQTKPLENCSVQSTSTTGAMLQLHGVNYMGSYRFSAKGTLYDNKNISEGGFEYNWEGLRFRMATAEKNGTTYNIELAVRSNMVVLFANEEVLEIKDANIGYGRTHLYTLDYQENGKFSFFIDDMNLFSRYQIPDGFQNVKPSFSFGSEVCAFQYKDMKLWGDMTLNVAPTFDETIDKNIISNVSVVDPFKEKMYKLKDGKISGNKNATTRIDFNGVVIQGNYRFFADAVFYDNKELTADNKEYDWEGLIFKVAKAKKAKKEYAIEVRVRNVWVLVYAVAEDGQETLLHQEGVFTPFGETKNYIINYQRAGTFDFWQNGVEILKEVDIKALGYSSVEPIMGIGGEVCKFAFNNMKLVCDNAKMPPTVPKKPAGNGNYADAMWISSGLEIEYKDGILRSLTDASCPVTYFGYLPFKTNETYVFSYDMKVTKAKQPWMGPRIIFGTDKNGKEFQVLVTESEILVTRGSEVLAQKSFARKLKETYEIDLLIEPNSISVWIDDILMIEDCKTTGKATTKMGVLFENSLASISNMDLYYTTPVKYVAPKVPEKPVYRKITSNQYNAADWMKVELNDETYGGYFGNKLTSNDSSVGTRYLFKNMPITDDMSYYYSANYRVTESSANWKGPRFIFRYQDKMPMYVAVTQSDILILADSEPVASAPIKMKIGQEYEIVIYSTPNAVTVWIDGECAMEAVDLSAYTKNGPLKAQMGLLFELCCANVTNLAIYGEDVKFNADYVDLELYQDKYYRMSGVPAMPEDGLNLFQNITMIDNSQGSLGAAFNSEKNILDTKYNNGVGTLQFVDASGSNNLNGLRNESGYVFSFTYKVREYKAKTAGESGFWMYLNRSAVPSTTQENRIGIGISGDAIMLKAFQDGMEIISQTELATRKNDKEYDIAVVHGKNWIKLYVDNVLTLVSTDLPTYNVQFSFDITNMSSVFDNFKLYEFEDSGLEILSVKDETPVITAGNTIFDAEEYIGKVITKWPIFLLMGTGIILLVSVGSFFYIFTKKKAVNAKKQQSGNEMEE